MYDSILRYLSLVVIVAIPLIVTALGGMFTERGGVTNIALDGLMIIGGFVGLLVANALKTGDLVTNLVVYMVALCIAGLVGILFSMIHAFASIKMKADQTISATAINTLTPALALFLTQSLVLGESQGSDKLPVFAPEFRIRHIPFLSDIPIIGDLFFKNVQPGLYVGIIAIIIASLVIFKTRFGLRLTATGENPHAADAAGISIYKMRYLGVGISGFLAGIGGFILVMTFNEFSGDVSGYGFLAIAVLIFGNWNPIKIMGAALLFSSLLTLGNGVAFFPFLENLGVPSAFWSMVPYIATIIVLIFTSKRSRAPKALGIAYDKGQR
ncbi:ABC-type uncharacterized transport system, permease component [Acholeplasma oculi]|uniref:Putative branched-chain amino acid ABC transporter, permease protein n=1 Tax=Acholeplasma oculi TaxID=35623 RepID=A0A061AJH5_9MOLU|nr:ABC transporter permease [Acholeplasma oculi]CDR31147.1 putative branched-chain amino acid ABC transporter, permease protein [Acholeplasma oculi]SKC37480.1 nucleoside ABC transporter membrane protein [Acholeplasma oculi]SUT90948.1 ABC-type uncharacterized transport system, permease component [Acholeplasma oculi]